MNKNEDYLDDLLGTASERDDRRDIADLLNAVREDEERTNREQESKKRKRDFGRQFFQEFEEELGRTEEDDDDFLRDFELELDAEEASKQMDEFPEEIFGKPEEKKEAIPDEQLIENINGIVNEAKKRVEGIEPAAEEGGEPENLFSGMDSSTGGEEISLMADSQDNENEQIQDEAALTEENGASSATDNLLEMLSGLSEDTDLSDIGAMLKADEDGEEIADDDEASDLEMLESIEELAGISGKKEKKKKEKKNGVFSKFLTALFGEEETENPLTPISEEGQLENISDENLDILRELDLAEGETPDSKGEKKKKKEKKKKEKKEKPPKEKKVKPKKVKKPKEPDLSPPLPKKPVILIVVMAASIFLLILLGSSFMSYSGDLSAAKENYRNGKYVEAYQELSGRKVKEADQQFYNRCAVMAMIQEEYQAYLALMDAGEYAMALDSLVRGVGRYDKYYDKAEEYEILLEYNELELKIEQVLGEQFGLSSDQALELYGMRRREDYSIGLRQILENLGLE